MRQVQWLLFINATAEVENAADTVAPLTATVFLCDKDSFLSDLKGRRRQLLGETATSVKYMLHKTAGWIEEGATHWSRRNVLFAALRRIYLRCHHHVQHGGAMGENHTAAAAAAISQVIFHHPCSYGKTAEQKPSEGITPHWTPCSRWCNSDSSCQHPAVTHLFWTRLVSGGLWLESADAVVAHVLNFDPETTVDEWTVALGYISNPLRQ